MNIFIHRNGENYGPYSFEQVKEYLGNGTLNESDLAWHDKMSDWLSIKDVITSLNTPPPAPPSKVLPPPPAVSPLGIDQEAKTTSIKKQPSVGKIIGLGLVGIGVIALGAVVLLVLVLRISVGSSANQDQNSTPIASQPPPPPAPPPPIEATTPATLKVKPTYDSLLGTYVGTIPEDKLGAAVFASMIPGDRTVTLQLSSDNTFEMQYAPDNVTFSGKSMLSHQDLLVLQDSSGTYFAFEVTDDVPPNLNMIGKQYGDTLAILKKVQTSDEQTSPSTNSDSNITTESDSKQGTVPADSTANADTSTVTTPKATAEPPKATSIQLVSSNAKLIDLYRSKADNKQLIALYDDNTYSCDEPSEANPKVYGTYDRLQYGGLIPGTGKSINFNSTIGPVSGEGVITEKGLEFEQGATIYLKVNSNSTVATVTPSSVITDATTSNNSSETTTSHDVSIQIVSQSAKLVGVYRKRFNKNAVVIALFDDNTYTCDNPNDPNKKVYGTYATHENLGRIDFNSGSGEKLGLATGDLTKGFVLKGDSEVYEKDTNNSDTTIVVPTKSDSNTSTDDSASANVNSIVGVYDAHDRFGHSSKLIIESNGSFKTVVPQLVSSQASGVWELNKLSGTIILHVTGGNDAELRINTDGSLNLNGVNLPKECGISKTPSNKNANQDVGHPLIPVGTTLTVTISEAINTAYFTPGQHYKAVLDSPIIVEGKVIVSSGSDVTLEAVGRHGLKLIVSSLTVNGNMVDVQTEVLVIPKQGEDLPNPTPRSLVTDANGTHIVFNPTAMMNAIIDVSRASHFLVKHTQLTFHVTKTGT